MECVHEGDEDEEDVLFVCTHAFLVFRFDSVCMYGKYICPRRGT